MKINYFLYLFITIIISALSSCVYIKKQLDLSGVDDIEKSILSEVSPCTGIEASDIFNRKDYTTFTNKTNIILKTENGTRWKFKSIDGKKIQTFRLSTPSEYFNDTIFYYFYKTEAWDGKKAILWVPGYGVRDFAFHFIKKIFYEELKQGYAILVYDLPYHLDRIKKGEKAGEGLITGNVLANINTLHFMSEELNIGYNYLQKIGVKKIAAWAGSIGASALSILATERKFDHICLMIPVLDWNTLIFNPAFKEVRQKLIDSSCNELMLRKAYSLVSPASYQMNIPPDRVLIQYAEYDQLTPSKIVMDYAKKRNICNIIGYKESHATILLSSSVYKDYAVFLKTMSSGGDK